MVEKIQLFQKTVRGNTDIDGAIITSQANASKNHLNTKTLSYRDIENRSEIEVKSVNTGVSTAMSTNAMNLMTTAASLLANMKEV